MAALVQEIRDRKVALERARRLADDVPARFTACRLSEKDRIDFNSAEGKRFLQGHGLPLSATFSIHRYGEHTCGVFCRYWVARVGFLMDLATGQAAGAVIFSEASMATFVEPAEFAHLAATARGHVLQRVEALRALRPK